MGNVTPAEARAALARCDDVAETQVNNGWYMLRTAERNRAIDFQALEHAAQLVARICSEFGDDFATHGISPTAAIAVKERVAGALAYCQPLRKRRAEA